MTPFSLDSSMTSMGGVFYPTGHVFALVPSDDVAHAAAEALHALGYAGAVRHATPDAILADIVPTLGVEEDELSAVGPEGEIVQRIGALAQQGQHGLLVALGRNAAHEVAEVLNAYGATAAFHYRELVIEELVPDQDDDPHEDDGDGDGDGDGD
ncbi:MAG: hypothetical protein ABWY08_16040 [Comamonas sp.]